MNELLQIFQIVATLFVAWFVHRHGKKASAISAVNELRERSDLLWTKIEGLPTDYCSATHDERALIASYLNEYEQFCALYNKRVIDRSMAKICRMQSIVDTYERYATFILRWRDEEKKSEAWKQLEECAKNIE